MSSSTDYRMLVFTVWISLLYSALSSSSVLRAIDFWLNCYQCCLVSGQSQCEQCKKKATKFIKILIFLRSLVFV